MVTARGVRHDRRDEVYQAAINVFCAKGFAAASMQDVADQVGLLKGSLYHYVASKDDMLKQIFLAAAEGSRRRIGEVAALDAGPAERLRALVERQVSWSLEHPEHATVLVREGRSAKGRQRTIVSRYRLRYESYLRVLIEDCVRAGVAPAELNVAHAVQFVLGALDATPEWYRVTGPDAPERVAQIYADLTLRAVLG